MLLDRVRRRNYTRESVQAVHSPAGGNVAVDGGRPAGWTSGLLAASRFGPSAGRLSDHPGFDLLPRCEPRRDGLGGDYAARAPVRRASGTRADDLHELVGWFSHYAAV